VVSQQHAVFGTAKSVRLVEDCLKDRPDIAGGAVDGPQHLGQRRLSGERRVALGAAFVEPLLQLRIGAMEIGGRVVEPRGHSSAPTSNRISSETRRCGMTSPADVAQRSRSYELLPDRIYPCSATYQR